MSSAEGIPPPRDPHPEYPPPGVTCQLCHTPLTSPCAKTSKRPSAFIPMAAEEPMTFSPPRDAHGFHPPPGNLSWRRHIAPSVPFAKSSRRPSAFLAAVGEEK